MQLPEWKGRMFDGGFIVHRAELKFVEDGVANVWCFGKYIRVDESLLFKRLGDLRMG